ncbi:MAG: hypothetical protein GXP53_06265 [Deltaproteobacteria bacterium]|nr:hypothetical protein [Deltaproteobacteria bacterium]
MLKNITLSAEASLIGKARKKAQQEQTTLNAQFRRWLSRYANADVKASEYKTLMDSLSYVNPGKNFTRDEMNER